MVNVDKIHLCVVHAPVTVHYLCPMILARNIKCYKHGTTDNI